MPTIANKVRKIGEIKHAIPTTAKKVGNREIGYGKIMRATPNTIERVVGGDKHTIPKTQLGYDRVAG